METPSSSPICPECGTPLVTAGDLCPRCLLAAAAQPSRPTASPLASTSLEQVAAAFPQLHVIELIGQGGMGAVFKVRQPKLDRFAALKLLPRSLAGDPAFAERFEREARLLARLSHPNIVSVYDFGQAGEFFFLLMEYVDGVNLRQAMRASPFEPRQALQVVGKICEALQYAHDEGVLHRDIKPENILLDTKGRVKLVDFGIAKLIADADPTPPATGPTDPKLTQAGASLGTPSYMAPEQREHPSQVDERADIYSLGVVFYELLTGHLPSSEFLATSHDRNADPPDPRIDAIVQQALQSDRERRQRTAGEVRTQVETVAAGGGGTPAAQAISYAPHHPRFSRLAIVGACWTPLFFIMVFLGLMPSYVAAPNTGPTPREWILRLTILPLGIAAPFASTLLGWIAVSQIRRSGGRLYGLGLAVFDGLMFPLLAFDVFLAFTVSTLVARINDAAKNSHSGPYLDLNANFVFFGGLLIAAVLDVFIIRWVWQSDNRPDAGTPPLGNVTQSQRLPPDRPALATTAISLATLAAVIGTVTWLHFPHPPPIMVWSILISALLAVMFALPAREAGWRWALAVGCADAAVWLAIFIALSITGGGVPVTGNFVRTRVFEADAVAVDPIVPDTLRARGDSLPTHDAFNFLPNVASETAQVDGTTLAALFEAATSPPGVVYDRRREIMMPPRLSDVLGSSKQSDVNGSIGGSLALDREAGMPQLRIEYEVNFDANTRGFLTAKLANEAPAPPPGAARVFFIPFVQQDGDSKYLVVAFQMDDAERGRAAAQASPTQPTTRPSAEAYRIVPGDLLGIGTERLQISIAGTLRRVRVSKEGYIKLPSTGPVKAAGLTPAQLAKALSERFETPAGELDNPVVTVQVIEARGPGSGPVGAAEGASTSAPSSRP